jgi:putative membrane protein
MHESLWRGLNPHPGVPAGVVALAAWYGVGLRRLWRQAGTGRGVAAWRAVAYGSGLLILLLALDSPLDEMADALFSAHMVQHLLLLIVVPPLFVAGAPLFVGYWALPRETRRGLAGWWHRARRLRRAARSVLRPVPVWLVNVVVLWFWHLPGAYDLAVRNEGIHAVEHTSFLVTAFFFWWLLFRHTGRRMDRGAGIIYVFTAGLASSALGAILTFAGSAWYAVHAQTTARWGFTPEEDQQLAGLIMWIPAGLAYLTAAGVLFVEWLDGPGIHDAGRRLARAQRQAQMAGS